MATRMPFEDIDRFYREIKSYANEDGYCVCSPAQIVKDMGKGPTALDAFTRLLVNAGCLIAYESAQERDYIRSVTFYKLTDKEFTREVYDEIKAAPAERTPKVRTRFE